MQWKPLEEEKNESNPQPTPVLQETAGNLNVIMLQEIVPEKKLLAARSQGNNPISCLPAKNIGDKKRLQKEKLPQSSACCTPALVINFSTPLVPSPKQPQISLSIKRRNDSNFILKGEKISLKPPEERFTPVVDSDSPAESSSSNLPEILTMSHAISLERQMAAEKGLICGCLLETTKATRTQNHSQTPCDMRPYAGLPARHTKPPNQEASVSPYRNTQEPQPDPSIATHHQSCIIQKPNPPADFDSLVDHVACLSLECQDGPLDQPLLNREEQIAVAHALRPYQTANISFVKGVVEARDPIPNDLVEQISLSLHREFQSSVFSGIITGDPP